MKIRWSAVIPTLNRVKTLVGTLDCLARQTLPPSIFEVLVVDNGSIDGTKEAVLSFIKEHPAHNIRYIRDETIGLLAGRHRGAQEARADILTFFDDDVEFANDFAVHILKAFLDGQVVLVGGPSRPRFEAEPPEWLEHYITREGGRMVCTHLSLLDLGNKAKDIAPEYVWGLNFSIRKQTLFEAEGFHPDLVPQHLQMYQGDGETGLSYKIKELGLKTRYVPEAAVVHIIPGSRLTEEYFHKRNFYQGVCDSYTEIRKKSGPAHLSLPLPVPVPSDGNAVYARIHNAYVEGYRFHQEAVLSSPKLLEWVLRPDYWDYAYPELEEGLAFSRPSALESAKIPLEGLRQDKTRT
ncbi:MAG: glycosyltransferase family 2 protein [Desulfovibrio sp.]|jgi:glycosyltransferase involved in cell wall biosynthesis|nr:glycosyltransferase family 2 protein [Desulfovibrio sp.]